MESQSSSLVQSDSSKDLSGLVREECDRLGLGLASEHQREPLTQREELLVEQTSFSSELKFSVPVDLRCSKKAFLNLVAGIEVNFASMWEQKAYNPREDCYPMGRDMDISFITETQKC